MRSTPPRLTHVGRYTLTVPRRETPFGGLYDAWDPLLSRSVSIRTLQFGLRMTSRIVVDRLLLDAARAAGDLHHRHIVAVHDAGLSAHGVYLAMEHLNGRDLALALEEGWRPTVGESMRLARRLADALAYAHARGVVHGAVEPGNILVTRNGRPKLMNVGIERVVDRRPVAELEPVRLARVGYQAPEVLAGGACDELGDVYSLGVVLFELLSGRPAFRGDTDDAVLQAALRGLHVPLAERCPELPAPIAELVESAMSRDPAQRPASAHALSGALRRLSGLEPQAPSAGKAEVRRPASPPRRRHWALRWAFPGTTW